MGVYDCYGNCQLKIGPCELDVYDIGDKVPITDGIYLDYGGAVVIKDGIFVAEFKELTDKYGGSIDIEQVVNEGNPLYELAQQVAKNAKKPTGP